MGLVMTGQGDMKVYVSPRVLNDLFYLCGFWFVNCKVKLFDLVCAICVLWPLPPSLGTICSSCAMQVGPLFVPQYLTGPSLKIVLLCKTGLLCLGPLC